MNYKQVKLAQQVDEKTRRTTTTWCPTHMAKKGKRLTVDGFEGEWLVDEVFDVIRTSEQLDVDRKAQRGFNDVLSGHAKS